MPEGMGGWGCWGVGYRYRSARSLASALDTSGWSTPRPGSFIPGKDSRYRWYGRLSGIRDRSGRGSNPQPSRPL